MARPLKRTVDYFPHFVNTGKTLLILQNEFGNDGYAFWFKLLSLLCKADGQVYDYNNSAAWRLLLAETCVSEVIANKVLQLLAEIDAIDPVLYQTKVIWVQHLVDNLTDVYTRRRNGSVPERPMIPESSKRFVPKTDQQLRDDSPSGELPAVSQGEFVPTQPISANIKPVNVNRKPQTKPKVNHTIGKPDNLPEFIDKDTWDSFLEMRGKKRAVPTEKAKELLVKELLKLKGEGDDPNEVLNQSIMRNYTGVFPLKGGKDGANRRGIKPGIPGNRPAGAFDNLEKGT